MAKNNEAGMRLSRFVQRVTLNLPDTVMYKSFRNRRIKVNGHRAVPEYRLCENDVVQLYLNDEFFDRADSARHPPVAGKLPDYGIEYEDKNIAVLYKPSGVLSHRDAKAVPTLLDAFTDTLMQHGEYDPVAETTFAPALCNRLDYGTEGLVLAAKNAAALRDMNEIIRENLLAKYYLCLCSGIPPQGLHNAFLTRDHSVHTVNVSASAQQGAKPIATSVEILESAGGYSLCRIQLITGRTHQIRAHLAWLGHPIVGDRKYGGALTPGFEHQALCAFELDVGIALPSDNSLAYLAGRRFTAESSTLPAVWKALKKCI